MPDIRPERHADRDGIRHVNESAFGGPQEAMLVDLLRERAALFLSFVAEEDGRVVGHIAFSPVRLTCALGEFDGMGLAPMAVEPARQRQGIGAALVRAGLGACAQLGIRFVVVLGHPDYYPRFGFTPASTKGVRSEYNVPDDVFMVLEIERGVLDGGGLVRYHPAFKDIETHE